jgi:hypothetical protein
MIAQLRGRHRRLWVALALMLTAILLTAWAARRPPQLMERLPETLLKNSTP